MYYVALCYRAIILHILYYIVVFSQDAFQVQMEFFALFYTLVLKPTPLYLEIF